LAISDEGFIFDPETGNSYTTNSTGVFILNLLKSGADEDEIVKALVEEYGVDEEEARRDLYDFLEQLRVYRLID